MLELGIKFLLSYFLGSVMGAMVMGRLRGGIDIRNMGSGNAGGTNAFRTQGGLFALGVIVIDIGKGAIGAGLVPALSFDLFEGTAPRSLIVYSCAAAAVMGHVWPVYHGFRGGKGAATMIGTLAVLAPLLLIPVLAVWLSMLVFFGFVGFATICAGIAAVVAVGLSGVNDKLPLFCYAIFCAGYMIYTHRSNIRRMMQGEEPQNRSVMLLRRRGAG